MIPDIARWLVQHRHALHRRPEVSGHEVETAARITQLLKECEADKILQGLGGHGVAAIYDSGAAGPTVGIRCELDGLPIQETSDAPYVSLYPGRGHLCGHDGHMAMVLGVAQALRSERPNGGRVVLLFQPAEETGQGAAAMRSDPRFLDIAPDYLFSLHNLPGLALGQVKLCQSAANCASRGMRIVLGGKTSHAAAPQDGVSPASALSALMTDLANLGAGGQLDDTYALTTVTHARLGEPTFGIAPGSAELWVTLRTVSDDRMESLVDKAEEKVKVCAEHHGLTAEIHYDDVFEACVNDADAVEVLKQACADQSVPTALVTEPQRFSEDFGQFAKGSKSAMFWLGAGEAHPQLHNPDYDFPDDLIPIGTTIFLSAIQNVLR